MSTIVESTIATPPAESAVTETVPVTESVPVEGTNGTYRLKFVEVVDTRETLGTRTVKIATQNENGPCPLLALCNTLLLRGDIHISHDKAFVTYEELVTVLGDLLLRTAPDPQSPTADDSSRNLKIERNLRWNASFQDVVGVLPTLTQGLDVNVKHDHPSSFEFTPALSTFDIFSVQLHHGWCVDPQDEETHRVVVEKCGSYNLVAEMAIAGDVAGQEAAKFGSERAEALDKGDVEKAQELEKKMEVAHAAAHDGMVAKAFLESTASQLTYHGLHQLSEVLPENSISVLFRNNHFSTLYRDHSGNLYTLVTDEGFHSEPDCVWETLGNLDGDSQFLTGRMERWTGPSDIPIIPEELGPEIPPEPVTEEEKIVMFDRDLALAMELQEQENRRHQEFLRSRAQEQQVNQEQYDVSGAAVGGRGEFLQRGAAGAPIQMRTGNNAGNQGPAASQSRSGHSSSGISPNGTPSSRSGQTRRNRTQASGGSSQSQGSDEDDKCLIL